MERDRDGYEGTGTLPCEDYESPRQLPLPLDLPDHEEIRGDDSKNKLPSWVKTMLAVILFFLLMIGISNAEQKDYNVVRVGHIGEAYQILCDEREQAVDILSVWALDGWDAMWIRYGSYRMEPNEYQEPICLFGGWMVAYVERTDHFVGIRNRDGTVADRFVVKVYNTLTGRLFWMISGWDVMSVKDYEQYLKESSYEPI